jgi:hypothetical protein
MTSAILAAHVYGWPDEAARPRRTGAGKPPPGRANRMIV